MWVKQKRERRTWKFIARFSANASKAKQTIQDKNNLINLISKTVEINHRRDHLLFLDKRGWKSLTV